MGRDQDPVHDLNNSVSSNDILHRYPDEGVDADKPQSTVSLDIDADRLPIQERRQINVHGTRATRVRLGAMVLGTVIGVRVKRLVGDDVILQYGGKRLGATLREEVSIKAKPEALKGEVRGREERATRRRLGHLDEGLVQARVAQGQREGAEARRNGLQQAAGARRRHQHAVDGVHDTVGGEVVDAHDARVNVNVHPRDAERDAQPLRVTPERVRLEESGERVRGEHTAGRVQTGKQVVFEHSEDNLRGGLVLPEIPDGIVFVRMFATMVRESLEGAVRGHEEGVVGVGVFEQVGNGLVSVIIDELGELLSVLALVDDLVDGLGPVAVLWALVTWAVGFVGMFRLRLARLVMALVTAVLQSGENAVQRVTDTCSRVVREALDSAEDVFSAGDLLPPVLPRNVVSSGSLLVVEGQLLEHNVVRDDESHGRGGNGQYNGRPHADGVQIVRGLIGLERGYCTEP